MFKKPIVFAHRGFSGAAPENTLVAFEKAIQLGVTGIELDVHLSKDGEVVVIHDERLNRTTNSQGLVVHHTLSELKKLDAGSWFSDDYQGERIPTLQEVLELLQGYSLQLNIELKTGVIDYNRLIEKVLDLVYRYGNPEETIYSSFNHYSLKELQNLDSSARIGCLFVAGIYEPWKYVKGMKAEAIHLVKYNVHPQLVQECHKLGIKVNTYTVDEEDMMRKVLQSGVDGIFTNWPNRLLNRGDAWLRGSM